ncbi:protein MENT [Ochotona curzoniae]|uniref:protein MENT n=1 Tax=Ochotona curzoniae TaxID=130825 RepID=UPI001B351B7E|nr:protein MENT [Ochotona curzoniae]
MVPAAGALLWALLLSLEPLAAGDQSQTQSSTKMPRATFRFGGPGPARSHRSTVGPPRTGLPRKPKVTLEDENDAVATADRLAGPAAAELLATVTGIARGSESSFDEDETLEEGVVINARKNNSKLVVPPTSTSGPSSSTGRFAANTQEREIRLTTNLPRTTMKPKDILPSEVTLNRWSTPGSTPSRWPTPSHTAMPPPEDLHLVLMPWGPWHCHCKAGTMSRTRSGKLQGLSGRLRVGALSQLRTEHRPCTYQVCPCNRLREECPLDADLCPDNNCSPTTTTQTTTTTPPSIRPSHRTLSPPPSPRPALAFWKRVRIGLEDIWNSLSTVFTEMQPVSVG